MLKSPVTTLSSIFVSSELGRIREQCPHYWYQYYIGLETRIVCSKTSFYVEVRFQSICILYPESPHHAFLTHAYYRLGYVLYLYTGDSHVSVKAKIEHCNEL